MGRWLSLAKSIKDVKEHTADNRIFKIFRDRGVVGSNPTRPIPK